MPRPICPPLQDRNGGEYGPAVVDEIELSIQPNAEPGPSQRGFRWKLSSVSDNWPLISREVFATRREAEKHGQAALLRARGRGRIR